MTIAHTCHVSLVAYTKTRVIMNSLNHLSYHEIQKSPYSVKAFRSSATRSNLL
jgi:hypothetical protein